MATTTYKHYNANPEGLNIDDCVIRALTVATGEDYYDILNEIVDYAAEITGRTAAMCRDRIQKGPGVTTRATARFMAARSWQEIRPIDSQYAVGKRATFRLEYMPANCVVVLRRHTAAIQYGEVVDTWDSVRKGTHKLYRYFVPPTSDETADSYWVRRATYTARKRGGRADTYLLSKLA